MVLSNPVCHAPPLSSLDSSWLIKPFLSDERVNFIIDGKKKERKKRTTGVNPCWNERFKQTTVNNRQSDTVSFYHGEQKIMSTSIIKQISNSKQKRLSNINFTKRETIKSISIFEQKHSRLTMQFGEDQWLIYNLAFLPSMKIWCMHTKRFIRIPVSKIQVFFCKLCLFQRRPPMLQVEHIHGASMMRRLPP